MNQRPKAARKKIRAFKAAPTRRKATGGRRPLKKVAAIRFHALADNLRDVIMVFDHSHRHCYVNAYVEKQTGIPAGKFIGKTHQELGFPTHLCRLWEEAIDQVFATGKLHRIEFELPSRIWIDWLLMPQKDERGKVQYVITAAREITERKHLEEELERRVAERTKALRKSEQKYRSLFEESKDMVYTTRPDGRLIDINPAGVALLGFSSKKEAMATNVRSIYSNPEDRLRFQEKMRVDGFVKDFEVTLKRRDGQPLQVLITANAVHDKQNRLTAYRGIIRDISERRRLEQQLFHVQKMESIGTMAGGIAHDFNNILGGILGYVSLMKTKLTPDHPLAGHLETIERGAQRAAELTSKLLAFAMGGPFHLEAIDLNEIIHETIKMVSRFFDRSLEVKTHLAPDLPAVDGDPALVQQVVMNLLVNARDAMPQGGKLTIETGLIDIGPAELQKNIEARPGRYVLLSVSDTGVGMAAGTLPRIFDPFFSTKEKGKGTGLGLAVVYGVVKNHGGFVTVYSEPGQGSLFRVYLPCGRKPVAHKAKAVAQAELHGTETILIVEDEPDIREMARLAFEQYGYRVLLAEDGEQGCEIYSRHRGHIDLVLLDMVMPRLDGMETLRRLKSIDPEVRVILSSGYSQNGRAGEVLKLGVAGFIQKPYQIQRLLALARLILDKKAR